MKNDIDKIDEQIEAIQNVKKQKPKPNGRKEKIVNNTPSTDTKKLDKIDAIRDEVSISNEGDTKKFDTVDVEQKSEEVKTTVVSEKSEIEEDSEETGLGAYIVCGVIILLLLVVLLYTVIFL